MKISFVYSRSTRSLSVVLPPHNRKSQCLPAIARFLLLDGLAFVEIVPIWLSPTPLDSQWVLGRFTPTIVLYLRERGASLLVLVVVIVVVLVVVIASVVALLVDSADAHKVAICSDSEAFVPRVVTILRRGCVYKREGKARRIFVPDQLMAPTINFTSVPTKCVSVL
jgi:hypothetical protein